MPGRSQASWIIQTTVISIISFEPTSDNTCVECMLIFVLSYPWKHDACCKYYYGMARVRKLMVSAFSVWYPSNKFALGRLSCFIFCAIQDDLDIFRPICCILLSTLEAASTVADEERVTTAIHGVATLPSGPAFATAAAAAASLRRLRIDMALPNDAESERWMERTMPSRALAFATAGVSARAGARARRRSFIVL